jgi:hypothetical protein
LGELATILERRPLWETWITALEQRAVALIEGGAVVPGWKLVRRSGNRKWRDEKEVQQAMMDAGLTENQMMETPKLKSPAQMEKVLPKAKRDIVEALVERPLGAPTLVAGNDTRDALPPRLGPIQ